MFICQRVDITSAEAVEMLEMLPTWSPSDCSHFAASLGSTSPVVGTSGTSRDCRDSGVIMGCGATTRVRSTGESAGRVPDGMDARFQLIGWVHICFVSPPALPPVWDHDHPWPMTHNKKLLKENTHSWFRTVQGVQNISKPSTKSAAQSHSRNPTWLAGRY